MGQLGALGYALDGTSYTQILGHYYGQTSTGATTIGRLSSSAPSDVRVALTENNGKIAIVTSQSPFSVAGVTVPAGGAAEMSQTSTSGRFDVYVGSACGGPWPSKPSASAVGNPVATPESDPPLGDPNASKKALQLCVSGGNLTVRGDLEATENSNGDLRTVNVLPIEEYVAGVVPNESPAYWGTLGGTGPQDEPWGFQELEAQAVAARSYVMSDIGGWGGYADTCDQSCQTYEGLANESGLTDQATSDTAGTVVLMPDGSVAATQYSSSTGGYTAGGTFAAVPDAGDAVCVQNACNPHHSWTAQVAVSDIEQTFPNVGTLESVDVNQRNGFGDLGGRVLLLSLVGSSSTVQLSGDQFAADFGLQSDWFSVVSQPSGGIAGYWMSASDGGVFSFGSAHFYGSMGGKPLDEPVVGMTSTPDGKGYWLVASDGGIFSYGDAHFYGSMGGKPLNEPVVGMTSTPDGKGYWLVASDGGVVTEGDASFEGSLPKLPMAATAVTILSTKTGQGYLVLTVDGHAVAFGDSPQFGDVAGAVPGYSGKIVGGAMVSQ
jgi:SpoIID/LytB domain protein